MEKLIDTKELAERLQVSVGMVTSLVYGGKIEYLRLGEGRRGLVRFSESQVQAYLAQHTITPEMVPALPTKIVGGPSGRKPGQKARPVTVAKFAEFLEKTK